MTREVSITNRHPRLRVPRAAVARAIAILDEQFPILPGDLRNLSLPRARLDSLKSKMPPVPSGELSLVFLTDPALAKIHGDFMGDPTATDVITFEGDATADLAGEICVSVDTAWRYVEGPRLSGPGLVEGPALRSTSSGPRARRGAAGLRLAGTRALQDDFSAELTLYVVHGWLHLAGYDDLQPAKKRRMRAAEVRAMKLLRAAQAVPEFRLV